MGEEFTIGYTNAGAACDGGPQTSVTDSGRTSPGGSVHSEDEFFDAISDIGDSSSMKSGEHSVSGTSAFIMSDRVNHDTEDNTQTNGMQKYRTKLPAQMYSRSNFSIWSFLRKCIGMELSKITMPVIFNEPLSFLQRICEYMEHTSLINKANASPDSIQRIQCVAAFAVSAVASNWERTGKPFNPLLGETYELFREDLGFRLVSEQVSHHPPVSAFHAEGLNGDFIFHGSVYPKLKFWGKSVEAEPRGTITFELPKHKEVYTWTNPSCCVHNVIIGRLWIEQYGCMEIVNNSTGERCCITFKPCGLFGKELHKLEGYVQDKSKKKVAILYGKWTECLWSVDPAIYEAHKKNDKKSIEKFNTKLQAMEAVGEGDPDDADDIPAPEVTETVYVLPGSKLLWRVLPRPSNSAQMYNFTSFAMTLNELLSDMSAIAPTDSRLRSDMQAMENGDTELASEEKTRLEEKQRAARWHRANTGEEWLTRWFKQGSNVYTGAPDWIYTGGVVFLFIPIGWGHLSLCRVNIFGNVGIRTNSSKYTGASIQCCGRLVERYESSESNQHDCSGSVVWRSWIGLRAFPLSLSNLPSTMLMKHHHLVQSGRATLMQVSLSGCAV